MSTDTPRIPAANWRCQPVLIRVGPEETLNLKALIDSCADVSCVPQQTIDSLGLWPRVELYNPEHASTNKKFIRLLQRIRPKIKEEEEFRKSKLRFVHYVMVKLFRLDSSTSYRRRIAQGHDERYSYFSIGQIRLEYVFAEQVQEGGEIPQMLWKTHVFEIVDSSGDSKDRPNHDMLFGVDSRIPDALWFQAHRSNHPRWRKVLQNTFAQ